VGTIRFLLAVVMLALSSFAGGAAIGAFDT
jgi:hypothetical protein